jgi:hypothetical protein
MGRRTAARVVPTAEPAPSTCSSNSAVVFTPVVPVEHVADDRESGAASNARYREDRYGQAYVLPLPAPPAPSPVRSYVKNGMFPFVVRRTVEVIVDGAPHRMGHNTPQPNESVLKRTFLGSPSRFRHRRLNGRQSTRFFLQVHRSAGSTIGPSSSAPPSPRRMTYQLSVRWSRRRL